MFSEKMKLGDIIRKIDFPNVKKNYDNREYDPSHQLKQFKSENDNISLEDLKVSKDMKDDPYNHLNQSKRENAHISMEDLKVS